jgi:hypothetical protein
VCIYIAIYDRRATGAISCMDSGHLVQSGDLGV